MFLTPQQIAQTRDHTLSNQPGLSAACFEAGQRLSELLAASSREALHQGSKQISTAAVDTVDIAGQEVHQITESLTAKKAPRQSPTPRSRARKV